MSEAWGLVGFRMLYPPKTFQTVLISVPVAQEQCTTQEAITRGKGSTKVKIVNLWLDFQFLVVLGTPPCDPPPPAPPGKIGVRKCSSTENQVSVMYYDLLNFEGDPTSLSIRSNSDKKNWTDIKGFLYDLRSDHDMSLTSMVLSLKCCRPFLQKS